MIRVVVADDEYKVCRLICRLINWEELDMELVGTAKNGVEALELIREKKPDLVMTDIKMPGYDGLELLKRAREIDRDMEFIIISGYSHFEYAQTAIKCGVCDYILKPVNADSLNATLQKVRQRYVERMGREELGRMKARQKEADEAKLRRTLWSDVVSGTAETEMDKVNEKYYYHFQEGLFRTFLFLVSVREKGNIDDSGTENVPELLYSKARIYMQKYVEPVCTELQLFLNGSQIDGMVNYSPDGENELYEAMKNVIQAIGMDFGAFENLHFYLGMGKAFPSFGECVQHYALAEKAAGQRLFAEETNFLEEVPEDVRFDEDALYQPFTRQIRRILDIKDAEKIGRAVDELREQAVSLGLNGCQLLAVARNAYRLFLLSGIFQSDFHFQDREGMENEFNRKAALCSTAAQLFSYLTQCCERDMEEACLQMDRERIRPINQAKQYIQAHYSEQLSLEDVSREAGFSPAYFSTLFHKETGQTFLEYLAEIRIEEAKKLLRESSINIELICGMVGSNDTKRFTKAFKKATGITPKEYRNLYS